MKQSLRQVPMGHPSATTTRMWWLLIPLFVCHHARRRPGRRIGLVEPGCLNYAGACPGILFSTYKSLDLRDDPS